MLSPQIEDQGLGVKLGDDGKDRFYFYHRGAIEGYQTFIVGYPKRGQGAIIMTNSDNGYNIDTKRDAWTATDGLVECISSKEAPIFNRLSIN